MITELNELTGGKSFDQLYTELLFQIHVQGESPGGEICGHIYHRLLNSADPDKPGQMELCAIVLRLKLINQ